MQVNASKHERTQKPVKPDQNHPTGFHSSSLEGVVGAQACHASTVNHDKTVIDPLTSYVIAQAFIVKHYKQY